jgi:hypothetical protein
MKKKNSPFIYLTLLVLIFTVCSRNISAQNISKNEQTEQVLAYWKYMQHFVKKKLAISKEESITFFRFYSASLDSDNIIFNKQVWSGALNIANVGNYIDNIVNKYVNKYNQFEAIKKEYPSSVVEYSSSTKSPQGACSGSCNNIGFENGTLSGWNAYYAQNNSASSFSFSANTGGPCGNVTGAANDPNTNLAGTGHDYQVEIMTGGNDAVVPSVPRVSPFGGNYSVRLGDSTNPNQGMALLNQTFMVTPANAAFTYQYAVFLENPNHPYHEQPFFRVTFLDQNGDTISCTSQFIISGSNIGFKAVYYPTDADSVYYTNWKSALAPLNHYIGQCVTVQFEVADCALGGHFGYAYIDAACNAMTITQSSPILCGKSTITLTGPVGAGTYKWAGPKNGIVGSNATQSVSVDTVGVYSLIITNPFSTSCPDTIYDTVKGTLATPGFTTTSSCLGAPTQFTNTSNPLSGAGVKFYWDFYGTGTHNDSTLNPAYTYTATGTYNVKLTEIDGACSAIDSAKVIVNALPTITISSSISNDTVCSGGAITLSGNGATSYAWSGGITNGVPFSPVSSGKYIITGTDANGCKNKDSVTVVTSTKALPTITITSSPANDIVCSGNPVTLSGNGGKTYSWSGGITNATPFIPASTNKYMVTGTDANGCSNKDSVIVTVDKPSITITASDSIPCIGTSITLSGNGGTSYSWSGGITNGTPFIPVSSGKYIVTGTDANTCSNKDSINIVIDNPIITITSSPVNDTVCTGGHITLSGNGGTNYVWSGGITNAVPFSPSSSGKYVVTGTDAYGCSNKDSVNIVAGTGALPTITATSSPTSDTICKGSTITLSGNGGYSYGWSGGISNAVAFTPSSSGKYIVTGTSANGCSNTDTVNVVVNPIPVITIIGQTPIISGTKDTLTAKGGISYVWSTGSTNDTTIVAPTTATKYVVTVTNANGCEDTASFTVTIKTITGISTIADETGTNLFPNPASEILNLAFNTNGKTIPAVIKVSDISGKQWIETDANLDGSKTISIDISRLSAGMYFVRIETNTSVRTIKFIKN